jgi:hypothetical protein
LQPLVLHTFLIAGCRCDGSAIAAASHHFVVKKFKMNSRNQSAIRSANALLEQHHITVARYITYYKIEQITYEINES